MYGALVKFIDHEQAVALLLYPSTASGYLKLPRRSLEQARADIAKAKKR